MSEPLSTTLIFASAHWVQGRSAADLELIADKITDLLLEHTRTIGVFTVTITLPEKPSAIKKPEEIYTEFDWEELQKLRKDSKY